MNARRPASLRYVPRTIHVRGPQIALGDAVVRQHRRAMVHSRKAALREHARQQLAIPDVPLHAPQRGVPVRVAYQVYIHDAEPLRKQPPLQYPPKEPRTSRNQNLFHL